MHETAPDTRKRLGRLDRDELRALSERFVDHWQFDCSGCSSRSFASYSGDAGSLAVATASLEGVAFLSSIRSWTSPRRCS